MLLYSTLLYSTYCKRHWAVHWQVRRGRGGGRAERRKQQYVDAGGAGSVGYWIEGLGEWSYNDCPEKKEGGQRQPTTSLLDGDAEIAEIG